MLRSNDEYYCHDNDDVDLFMKLLEKKGYKWCTGRELRSRYQQAPILYIIENDYCISCSLHPSQDRIDDAIHVSNIRNKIISELRR